nr:MAG TPA: hypothetical protein [Microviridae sp.]
MPTSNKRVGIFGENFHKKVITNELYTFPHKVKVFLADKPIQYICLVKLCTYV